MKKNYKKVIKPILVTTLITSLLLPVNMTQAEENSEEKVSMSYVYNKPTEQLIEEINDTNGAVNVITPKSFEFLENGRFYYNIDPVFIEEMHSRGIKVVPFVTNAWNGDIGRAMFENAEYISTELANIVQEYNLDGLNIDIEGISHRDKEGQTEFIRLIREKLPEDKELSIAVAANPNDWTEGWHGSYEYEKLNKYVDYFMVMAYDESWYGSDAGPTASITFVERSIKQLLSKEIDSQKIVLGVPFYGRFWADSKEVGGTALANSAIRNIVNRFGATEIFDEYSKTPYARVTIDYPISVGNTKLEPDTYTFWYENEESMKYKFRLVEKYNLKGLGSWQLSLSDSETWEFVPEWINGEHYFLDMVNHPLEDKVLYVTQQGYLGGYELNKFEPDKEISRQFAFSLLEEILGEADKSLSNIISNLKLEYKYRFKESEPITMEELIETADLYFGYTLENKEDISGNLTRADLVVILYDFLKDKE